MIGDIILLNRKKGGWFSTCQRFFTGMPYTHCTISVGEILGFESTIGADEKVVIEPIRKFYEEDSTDIEIYRLRKEILPLNFDTHMSNTMKYMYCKYANQYYGFSQILWFVYRWLMEKFGKDVRRNNNPFKGGVICSELIYLYLVQLTIVLNKCYPKKDSRRFSVLLPLQTDLNRFTADTIHAGDIASIIKMNTNIWELVK